MKSTKETKMESLNEVKARLQRTNALLKKWGKYSELYLRKKQQSEKDPDIIHEIENVLRLREDRLNALAEN
tara:strand:+ start:1111 stop:1323 length:213 start_codon:yes stop_codon:yes gene_type:complete